MNIKRRVFALVLLVALSVASNCNAYEYKDVKGTEFEQAASMLLSINVLEKTEDGTFKPEESITRGQFAKLLAREIGVNDVKYQRISKYNDVDDSCASFSEINVLTDMGIFENKSDNKFYPDNKLEFQQAVKFIVIALGYKLYAENKGGYPVGYMMIAAEKGIVKGIDASSSEVNRGITAKLLYNALFVDLMEVTSYSKDIKYNITKDKNLLSEIHNIYKVKGRITENGETALVGKTSVRKDEVKISSDIYKVGVTNASDYLGYNVTAYYKTNKNTEDKLIVAFFPDSSNNEIIIKADDIVSFKDRTYTYSENGEETGTYKAVISIKADIIYNKKHIAYDEQYLVPEAGSVTLVDADSDGEYEFISIINYQNIVVDNVNIEDEIIAGKYGVLQLELDMNDDNKTIIIKDKDGKDVDVSFLYEWDVLSYIKSLDGDYFSATLIQEYVNGTVTEIGGENGKSIWIENNEYKLAASYPNYGVNQINVDDNGDFLKDIEGKLVAFVKNTESAYIFGYLIKAEKASAGVDDSVQFKIFSADGGKIKYFKAASKVKLDGNPCKGNSKDLYELDSADGQLIRYMVNKNGEIRTIDTQKTDEIYENENNAIFNSSPKFSSVKQRFYNNAFGGSIVVNSQTIVFFIPTDRSQDEMYRIKYIDYFRENRTYTVSSYNTNKKDFICAEAIIMYSNDGDGEGIIDSTHMSVIDKITTTIDEAGNRVEKVYIGRAGVVESIYSKDDSYLTLGKIKTGDVVRFGTDYNKRINSIEYVYDYNEDDNTGTIKLQKKYLENADFDDGCRIIFGYVYLNKEGVIKISTANPKTIENIDISDFESHVVSRYKVLLYDNSKKDNKVRKASADDILDYMHYGEKCSKVLIQTKYAEPMSIIIYN